MIAVVQRVRSATVATGGEVVGRIGVGLCVLAAVVDGDDDADLRWTALKIATLRVFPEDDKAYHLNVAQVGGGVLLVSNFTVAATVATGRRPGFDRAMKPDAARPMFERFVRHTRDAGLNVATGRFGADMAVNIENDGPLTLILESPSCGGRAT